MLPLEPERVSEIAHGAGFAATPEEVQAMASALLIAHARARDHITSKAAAASVGKLTARRRAVVRMFQSFGPMTDATLVSKYHHRHQAVVETETTVSAVPQSESGLRTRRSELVTFGLLRDTGTTERLPSGRRAVVWGLAEPTQGDLFRPTG